MRRAALIAAGTAIAVGLLLVTLEVLAIAALSLKEGRYQPAHERFRRETNRYVAHVTAHGRCQYVDSLFPHPYLGFVHHGNPPCGIPGINGTGLFGAEFPTERRPDRFVVLLTGGSVAAELAGSTGGPSYLEDILNESYQSPTGRPFLLLNGGAGAWKQPQQAILFMLWSDVLDAVVTLDGFNEMWALRGVSRFEHPSNNFAVVNPLATDTYDAVVRRWALGRLIGWVSQDPVASRSHAAFLAVRGARALIEPRSAHKSSRRTTVNSLFALPPGWNQDQRVDAGIEQYKKYIRAMLAQGRDRGIRSAHFIQPVPAIAKSLTSAERAVVGELDYEPLYRRMVEALLTLRAEGVPIFSLVSLFRDISDTIYADQIHLRHDRGNSEGYRLMAQEMAQRIGPAWGLRAKR